MFFDIISPYFTIQSCTPGCPGCTGGPWWPMVGGPMSGAPGELRLCYANLPSAQCSVAAERLKVWRPSDTDINE